MLLLWWLVVGLGVLPVPGAVVEGGVEVHRASVRGGKPGDLLEHVLSGRGSEPNSLTAERVKIWQKVSHDFLNHHRIINFFFKPFLKGYFFS